MDASAPAIDHKPEGAPAVASGRIGVLLVNLGTPDATDYRSMRRYLKEFLSDKRVIEADSLLWKLVFHGGILTIRPRLKGHDYDKIWNKERDESPLKTITRAQAEKLAAGLPDANGKILVGWAMRYGNPSIRSRVMALTEAGCERLLILPLYPQYCAATTATVCDEVFRVLATMRRQPTVRIAPPYYDDPVYIDALAQSLRGHLARLTFEPEVIIASFHGIPKDYIDKGDPYYSHCARTTRLLRERLGFDDSKLMLTFQSRFGRAEWLKPYTDMTVKALAQRGVKNIAVVMPGFSADCLETLEEIAGENGEIFKHNGGEDFAAIPCLNDSSEGMTLLTHLAKCELSGWI